MSSCLLLGAVVGVGAAPPVEATPTFTLTRLAGNDRFSTAATVATATFPNASVAVLANGRDFPDALAGNYLAGQLGAPVLLSERDTVPQSTLNALFSLGVTRVVLLGGTGALAASVEAALGAGGFDVSRVSGADRFATAAAVAREGGAPASHTALLASGRSFPDALAAGPLAYGSDMPQLLTEPGSLSPAAAAAIDELGITNVLVLGGPGAVSDAVVTAVQALGVQAGRLAGADRYATSVAIADFAAGALGHTRDHIDVATGTNFPDALAGGAHAGSGRHTIVLVEPGAAASTGAAQAYLRAHSPEVVAGHVFGGVGAVDDAAVTVLEQVGQGTTTPANQCETAMLQQINLTRLTNVRLPLTDSPEARTIARRWSEQMAAADALSHNPNTPTQLEAAGIHWTAWAENVGFGGSVPAVHDLFMGSDVHRGNILSGDLTHVGIGCVTAPDGTLWVTEVFFRA